MKARKWVREITRRISCQIRPQKIILFGSYARGKPGKDSDIDLFIVWDSKQTRIQCYQEISKAIGPRLYPMDIVIRTPDELEKRKKWIDPFTHEVMSRGIVLYDRSQSRG